MSKPPRQNRPREKRAGHSDRGYNPGFGSKNYYKQIYREGYEQGYRQGYDNGWRHY